jgi:hypothetical protein
MKDGSEVKGTPKRGTDNNKEDKRELIAGGGEGEERVINGSQGKAGQTSDSAAAGK